MVRSQELKWDICAAQNNPKKVARGPHHKELPMSISLKILDFILKTVKAIKQGSDVITFGYRTKYVKGL